MNKTFHRILTISGANAPLELTTQPDIDRYFRENRFYDRLSMGKTGFMCLRCEEVEKMLAENTSLPPDGVMSFYLDLLSAHEDNLTEFIYWIEEHTQGGAADQKAQRYLTRIGQIVYAHNPFYLPDEPELNDYFTRKKFKERLTGNTIGFLHLNVNEVETLLSDLPALSQTIRSCFERDIALAVKEKTNHMHYLVVENMPESEVMCHE